MKSRSDGPRLSPAAAIVLALMIAGGVGSLAMVVWAAGRVGS